MSLKQEIETWVAALAAYDHQEFDSALRCFTLIADTSKILFNLGVINATLGEHARAVEFYQKAIALDQYLAVAYFQQGVSNFLMGDFEEALANFNDTLLYLRGNNNIDYEQLGLKFKLHSCEVLFNRGLCYIYLQQKDAGMQDLIYAAREKAVPDHSVIDEAIKEQAEGYTVFSIPVGVVYRPNEAKVKNLKTKDYLGKARLVAQYDQSHSMDSRRQAALAARAIDDRPGDKLSYAALNLVKPDLRSRSRQHSEPPLHRNLFPPTPPPEPERPDSTQSYSTRRSYEVASPASGAQHQQPSRSATRPLPLRLDLGAAAFDQRTSQERPRVGPKRSESERPALRREFSNGSTRSQDSRRADERSRRAEGTGMKVEADPIEAYSRDVTRKPPTLSHRQSPLHPQRIQPVTISEEEEEGGEGEEGDEVSEPSGTPLAFEIVPPRPTHRRHRSQSKREPDLRKLRVKVHGEDMRYVMTTPAVKFEELSQLIRLKFALQGAFKLKIRDDDGDMVTMADQDDLDMALAISKTAAAKEKTDMGKMEIWVQEI